MQLGKRQRGLLLSGTLKAGCKDMHTAHSAALCPTCHEHHVTYANLPVGIFAVSRDVKLSDLQRNLHIGDGADASCA